MKYSLFIDKNTRHRRHVPEYITQFFYGQLDFIVACTLLASCTIGLERPATYILGLVQTCKSELLGRDAAREVVSYSTMHPPAFINPNAILCVVGRVHVSNK
ncbi:hypothetical protein JB92DRAFT_2857603 [Gautieria morchelliformis]|nr:hypothetical protein JB92DRAFT_2857603 [Gautieria morchelliformis]